jgi:hypothetical protein
MCENKVVKKVSFTGSTPVAKLLYRLASSTLKKCVNLVFLKQQFLMAVSAECQSRQEETRPSLYSMTLTSTKQLRVRSLSFCFSYLYCPELYNDRCDCIEIPLQWPDMHLRKPHICSILCLCRLCLTASRESCCIQSWERTRRKDVSIQPSVF